MNTTVVDWDSFFRDIYEGSTGTGSWPIFLYVSAMDSMWCIARYCITVREDIPGSCVSVLWCQEDGGDKCVGIVVNGTRAVLTEKFPDRDICSSRETVPLADLVEAAFQKEVPQQLSEAKLRRIEELTRVVREFTRGIAFTPREVFE